MNIYFYADGPSKAPAWEQSAREWQQLANINQRLRLIVPLPPAIAGILTVLSVVKGEWVVMVFCAVMCGVYAWLAHTWWRDLHKTVKNCHAHAVECESIAADMRLGLWPAVWQTDAERAFAQAKVQP